MMVEAVEAALPEAGYEQDFFAWTQAQAAALRAAARGGVNLPVDWENVAEEIESLGKSDARELRSRIATIIEHLLKLEFARSDPPRAGWAETVVRSRDAFEKLIAESPSLQRRVAGWIEAEHRSAARLALMSLDSHGEGGPDVWAGIQARRYNPDQVLGDWLPDV